MWMIGLYNEDDCKNFGYWNYHLRFTLQIYREHFHAMDRRLQLVISFSFVSSSARS